MSDFTELAQKQFQFLVEENGFACEVESGRYVIYRNEATTIRIGFGEREGSVGITFDLNPQANYYPFEFYLKIFFSDEHAKLAEFPIRSKKEMEIALMKLVGMLKRCGQPIIRGDLKTFRKMATETRKVLQG
jgi:hypothetical protein